MNYFRSPKTQNERKQYETEFEDWYDDDFDVSVDVKVRCKRKPKYLPSDWDDIRRAKDYDRSWKNNGKRKKSKQWM